MASGRPRRLLLTAMFAVSVAAGEEIQRSEAELDSVRARLQALQAELAAAEAEKDQQGQALREVEEEIGAVTLAIRDLTVERDAHRAEIARLQAERKAHESSIGKQQHRLGREVRASYLMGRQERLKLLLNQEDPGRLSRVLAYYEYLQRRRVARIAEIQSLVDQLEVTGRAIAAEEARLETVLAKQQAARERLEARQLERQALLAALETRIRQRGGEVAELQRDQERLSGLLERLRQEQARQQAVKEIEAEARIQQRSFTSLKGELSWPATGSLRAAFGAPKGGGLRWDGALIGAPAGDDVRAIHGGRVVFADWLKGYGLLMILDHGDGYMSLYGYNQSLYRTTGDWVTAGEVIGAVGSSGGRLDSSLYFGIRHNGKPVDPARWCRRASGRRVGAVNDEHRRSDDAA